MPSTLRLKSLLFFYYSAMTILVSYLPVYFQGIGLKSNQIGVLLAIGPLAGMISQPLWGYMTDKYRTSKKMIIICLICSTLTGLVMFLSYRYSLLIFTVFIFYIFMAPIGGLSDSLTQKTAFKMKISFGTIRMWGSIGFAVMSLLSGFLLAFIGIQYIYIPFLLFIVITLFISFGLKDSEASKKHISVYDALQLLKNRKLISFIFIMLFVTVTHRTNDSFLGIYITDRGGSEAFIGWAWFIGVISEAFIFATAVHWFKKYHPLTFIIVSAIIFTFRWFIMGFIENPFLVLPLQMMHGLSFGIFYLCAFDYITKIIPEELQSTGHLLFYSFFFGLSGMIGSSIGGEIINQVNTTFLYSIMGYVSFIGAILIAIYQLYYFYYGKGNVLKGVK